MNHYKYSYDCRVYSLRVVLLYVHVWVAADLADKVLGDMGGLTKINRHRTHVPHRSDMGAARLVRLAHKSTLVIHSCALRALAATQVCGGAHDRLRGQLERVAELLRFVRRPELPVSILK